MFNVFLASFGEKNDWERVHEVFSTWEKANNYVMEFCNSNDHLNNDSWKEIKVGTSGLGEYTEEWLWEGLNTATNKKVFCRIRKHIVK